MASSEQISENVNLDPNGKVVKRRRLGRSFGNRTTSWTPPYASPPCARNSGGTTSQAPGDIQKCSGSLSTSSTSKDSTCSTSKVDVKTPSRSYNVNTSNTKNRSTVNSCTPRSSQLKSRGALSARRRFRGDFKSPMRASSSEKKEAETPGSIEENESLRSRLAELNKEIDGLREEGCSEEELQEHIKKMHEYNELKDMAQMLLGRIAMLEGITTKQLHEEMGLGEDD